jgi:UPF0042 nucleotide-binding protein
MKIIVVSGLSGGGKSVALGMLEDLDYYCIDNLPLNLLSSFTADTLRADKDDIPLLAVGIDARAQRRSIAAFPERIEELRADGIDIQVLFFQADREVILRRYSETRRKHPLSTAGIPLTEAVDAERALLQPIAACADWVIDTSRTNIHQLREMVRNRLQSEDGDGLSLLFQSFGFKYGMPDGVDFVFDARCLPNPHWQEGLREQTGRDEGVREYLEAQPDTLKFADDIRHFLEDWLPRFRANDRSYVTIGIGCTGGKHRSVYLVERLAATFLEKYPQTSVRHTELP